MELTPIFRIEKFLDAIINSTTPPEPVFRVEYFLAKIGGADVVTPEPLFRIEKYLAKILGEDVEIPEPMFRTEFWLAKKCGEDVETPDPAFRVEYWLEEWCGGSAPTYETITGRIVSFLTQRIAPLKIEASLSPIQDLHGYDNPWPPGGGKNLFDEATAPIYQRYFDASNWLYASDSKSYLWPCKPSTTYTISSANSSATIFRAGYLEGEIDPTGTSVIPAKKVVRYTSTSTPITFTTSENATYIAVQMNKALIEDRECKIQIEESATASSFSPYSNECPISGHTGAEVYVEAEYDAQATPTVTVTFGQTVYGGTLTVNEDGSGQVVADRAEVPLPTSQSSWNDGYGGFYLTGQQDFTITSETRSKCACNILEIKTEHGTAVLGLYPVNHSIFFEGLTAIGITTIAQFLTWIQDNSVKVIAPLTTPITIPMTPGQVNALQGQNVVWVDDSGEIKVTYRSN